METPEQLRAKAVKASQETPNRISIVFSDTPQSVACEVDVMNEFDLANPRTCAEFVAAIVIRHAASLGRVSHKDGQEIPK